MTVVVVLALLGYAAVLSILLLRLRVLRDQIRRRESAATISWKTDGTAMAVESADTPAASRESLESSNALFPITGDTP